jgi:formylglycine-generating enzyme required for sulfatase activity
LRAGETVSGSVVARLEIVDRGDYRIEVSRSVPDGATAEPGSDTAIALRRTCNDESTQIACAESFGAGNNLSRIGRITLEPGVYFVVTGGRDPAPADLTLFASRVDAFIPVPETETPKSTADALALEPMPGVTIDRLIMVDLRAGERGRVDVTLHGECFGTPAILEERASCVDVADTRQKVSVVRPAGDLSAAGAVPPPWVGDQDVPCNGEPRPEEVCVRGGAFVLGDVLALEDLDRRSQPERMRVVEPFFMDRFEMSVGRFRDALARGFVPASGMPLANDNAALVENVPRGMCTWSTVDVGRERHPLSCVSWATAHELCLFLGGDLPTEEQWEYAATAAGRQRETRYPWGNGVPTCATTVFSRTSSPTAQCAGGAIGPVPVDDGALVAGDVTPLGIVGLAGNLEELLASPFVPYSDRVWREAGLRRPVEESDAPLRSARGADWAFDLVYATASTRRSEPATARYSNVGFRCARRAK